MNELKNNNKKYLNEIEELKMKNQDLEEKLKKNEDNEKQINEKQKTKEIINYFLIIVKQIKN